MHFTGSLHSAAKCPLAKQRKHLTVMLTSSLPLVCRVEGLVVGCLEGDGALTSRQRLLCLRRTVVHPSSSSACRSSSSLEGCRTEVAEGWSALDGEWGIECSPSAATRWEPVSTDAAVVNADLRQDLVGGGALKEGEERRMVVVGPATSNRTRLKGVGQACVAAGMGTRGCSSESAGAVAGEEGPTTTDLRRWCWDGGGSDDWAWCRSGTGRLVCGIWALVGFAWLPLCGSDGARRGREVPGGAGEVARAAAGDLGSVAMGARREEEEDRSAPFRCYMSPIKQ